MEVRFVFLNRIHFKRKKARGGGGAYIRKACNWSISFLFLFTSRWACNCNWGEKVRRFISGSACMVSERGKIYILICW